MRLFLRFALDVLRVGRYRLIFPEAGVAFGVLAEFWVAPFVLAERDVILLLRPLLPTFLHPTYAHLLIQMY
jgi:hypothetical protein